MQWVYYVKRISWAARRAEDLTYLMPELNTWLQDGPAEHYPDTRTFEEARNEAVHINQTSGTTGTDIQNPPFDLTGSRLTALRRSPASYCLDKMQ